MQRWTTCLVYVIAMTSLMTSQATDECSQNSDGCSIPFDMTYFYEELFTPSCYKHDVCYSCGNQFGFSRKECDEEFLRMIKNECKTLRKRRDVEKKFLISEEDICKGIAYNWYGVVRLGGSSRYRSPSRSWCSESWVSSCLP